MGGWGSSPRPADYEKYGSALRVRYLHGYDGVVPPIALFARSARVARSTNRSTPYMVITGFRLRNVTARPVDRRVPAPGGVRPPEESQTLLTAEPLDLDYKHEIIRRVHQEREQAPPSGPEMQ